MYRTSSGWLVVLLRGWELGNGVVLSFGRRDRFWYGGLSRLIGLKGV